MRRLMLLLSACLIIIAVSASMAGAQSAARGLAGLVPSPDKPQELAASLKLLLGLSVLSLAPSLLIMLTSFTRIIIILSFLRSALGTQQAPPNAILIGLALFLTFFIMQPVWQQVDGEALKPYMAGKIGYEAAVTKAAVPVRGFLMQHTREKDLGLFITLARQPRPQKASEVSFGALVPAFIISELRTGFQIGFVLFIPFVVLDIVVSSVLMSLGMMMLPPVMVSLPLKILLFVMVDGWQLVMKTIVMSFG